MKKYVFLLGFLGLNLALMAQFKMLSLEESVADPKLYPERLQQYRFLPSGNYFCYALPGSQTLYINRIDKIWVDSSVRLGLINKQLEQMQEPELNNWPQIQWLTDRSFQFYHARAYFVYHLDSQLLRMQIRAPKRAQIIEWNPQKTACIYTFEHNLYYFDGAQSHAITSDGSGDIVYGDAVHRSEFGIRKGLFWSADGKQCAFYRMDQSAVTDYPLLDNSAYPAVVNTLKYPAAGQKSHHVKVGIFFTQTQRYVYLNVLGPPEQYLTNLTWSPDARFLYVAKLSRNQKNMWLERYWAHDGVLDQVVAEEFNAKYVEPEQGPIFLPWDPNQFLWFSQKDGYNHLYWYHTDGKLIKQVTSGPWVVQDIAGFNAEQKWIYVHGTLDGPLDRHLYAVSLESKKVLKISRQSGQHQVQVNAQGTYFLDAFSSLQVPSQVDLLSESGALLRTLHVAPNPLQDYELGETTLFPIKHNNTILYARMIKPAGFDPSKQYPVLVYVYGGPHVQLVKNAWLGGGNNWMQFLAQQGFIVFTIDNRGSQNRGFEFESAIHKQLGTLEVSDQLAGVDWLKKQPFVDPSRIGVHGWSYGGFMSLSLMSKAPGVFKTAVAGGPVIDWKLYEVMYTERYMETPESNPEGYKKSNLLNYVPFIQDKVMLIHGTHDDVVLWQHSLLFLEEAIKNRITHVDYFVYPNHKHNVYGPDRVHLMHKITQYLFDNL